MTGQRPEQNSGKEAPGPPRFRGSEAPAVSAWNKTARRTVYLSSGLIPGAMIEVSLWKPSVSG